MKIIVAALFAVSALAATTAASANPFHHHRHQVCEWRHHHRVCHWG
jgi:hypothetical protein